VNRPAALASVVLLASFAASRPALAQTMPPMPATPLRALHVTVDASVFAGLPRRTVSVHEDHGGTASYSGVDLGAVLARAGAPSGHAIGGAALASYVLVRASDGYRVAFALPELDPAFTDRVVLLADRRNGAPLPPELGPFRVVVPDEKRGARWIRNVTAIDLIPIAPP